ALRREVPRLDLETQQPALERAVEERVRALRFDPELEAERRVACQHRGVPAREARAQRLAESRVELRELALLAETLAVRRVDRDEAARCGRVGQLAEPAALDRDPLGDPGRRGVR